MLEFTSGLIAMGFFIAGLFFFKFWHRTADALFAFFALAFLMLALNQTLTAFSRIPLEERTWLYLLRLAAFVLILIGIVTKNQKIRRT